MPLFEERDASLAGLAGADDLPEVAPPIEAMPADMREALRMGELVIKVIPSGGDMSGKAAAAGGALVTTNTVGHATPGSTTEPVDTATAGDVEIMLSLKTGGGEQTACLRPVQDKASAYFAYRLAPFLEGIITALCDNVYAAGFALEPVIDLDEPDAAQKVREYLEYLAVLDGGLGVDATPPVVSEEQVTAELDRLRQRMRLEHVHATTWFRNCGQHPHSYKALCRLQGQDMEVTGEAFYEVLRDVSGRPVKLAWAPSYSIWPCVYDAQSDTAQMVMEQATPVHWREVALRRKFRRFVQVDISNQITGFFKEFGDRRVMSRLTGAFFGTLEALQADEHEQKLAIQVDGAASVPLAATELLHFPIPFGGSSVRGKPRWTPSWPDLLGCRETSEQNRLIMTDQKVPQMLIFLYGVRANDKDVDRMEEKINSNADGVRGVHVMRVIPAANFGKTGPTSTNFVHIEKLRDVQHTDGLGFNYTKQAEKHLRRQYRMPRVVVGDDENITRDATFAMFRFAEDQVYDPIRDIVDDPINNRLLPELGILLWRYRTQSRAPRDPELLANIVRTLSEAGVLTPSEGREICELIFNKEYRTLHGAWAKLPVRLLTAVLQTKNQVIAGAVLGDEKDLSAALRKAIFAEIEAARQAGVGGGGDGGGGGDIDEPNDRPIGENRHEHPPMPSEDNEDMYDQSGGHRAPQRRADTE